MLLHIILQISIIERPVEEIISPFFLPISIGLYIVYIRFLRTTERKLDVLLSLQQLPLSFSYIDFLLQRLQPTAWDRSTHTVCVLCVCYICVLYYTAGMTIYGLHIYQTKTLILFTLFSFFLNTPAAVTQYISMKKKRPIERENGKTKKLRGLDQKKTCINPSINPYTQMQAYSLHTHRWDFVRSSSLYRNNITAAQANKQNKACWP